VTLTAGGTESVSLQPKRCGALVQRVTPPNTTFALESRDWPTRTGVVVQEPILLLPAGAYRLRLSAEGCGDYEASVELLEGQRKEHFATMDCPTQTPSR
jgi:hypothetical protein